jgi:hypothetical protein
MFSVKMLCSMMPAVFRPCDFTGEQQYVYYHAVWLKSSTSCLSFFDFPLTSHSHVAGPPSTLQLTSFPEVWNHDFINMVCSLSNHIYIKTYHKQQLESILSKLNPVITSQCIEDETNSRVNQAIILKFSLTKTIFERQ